MRQSPLFSTIDTSYAAQSTATYRGVTLKTITLLAITALFAVITAISLPQITNMGGLISALIASSIIGFISVIVGRTSVRAAKYCGVIYSACQGLFLGTMTAILEVSFPGISLIAIFSTLIIFGVMLVLFATGVIRYGSFLRKVCISMGIAALLLVLFISIVYTLIPGLANNFGALIAIEGFLLVYGAITLSMNFAEVQYLVESGFDEQHEWTAALGLMVSIIYIYVEVLRLAAIILANKD